MSPTSRRVSIGPLRPDEAAAAVALWQEAGLTRPWNDPDADLARALRGPDSTVLAARAEDGSLVGTAMLGHDGHRAWVYYLAVAGDRRRTGCGRALMAAAEAWVRAREIPKIQLMVRADNPLAQAFYDALGYGVQDVVVMGHRLS